MTIRRILQLYSKKRQKKAPTRSGARPDSGKTYPMGECATMEKFRLHYFRELKVFPEVFSLIVERQWVFFNAKRHSADEVGRDGWLVYVLATSDIRQITRSTSRLWLEAVNRALIACQSSIELLLSSRYLRKPGGYKT